MLRAVVRGAEGYAARFRFGAQLAQHVAARSHFKCVPVRKLAFIHLESIVVLGYRHHIFCARFCDKIHPLRRVELLRPEHGNKVLIAEPVLRAVDGKMMFIRLCALHVHIARIPLAAVRRNGINAPVDENAQLRILIPFRIRVRTERFPRIGIGALFDHALRALQNFLLPHRFLLHRTVVSPCARISAIYAPLITL